MFESRWLNKRLGRATHRLSAVIGRPVVWAPPHGIAIEVTNTCNLRCPMCKLGQKSLGRDVGLMDFDKYCKLINEIAPFVSGITFPWYGEPFTRKDLGRFVKHASEKRLVIHLLTNGTQLHKCEIDYLVDCQVRAVGVAIDGLEQKTYEAYRVGGDLAEVTAGVSRLAKLRNERGSKYPRIDMKFLVMSHNEHELPRVEEFGRKIGADRVKVKGPHVDRSEEGKEFLPKNEKYRRYETDFSLKSGRDTKPGCPYLWKAAVISHDGIMGLCCMDSDCEHSPGNVFEEGFFNVWFGERMQAFRRAVLNDKKSISVCEGCHRS